MKDKITLVTAFFQIGRGEWSNFKRTNDDYFNYFDFWARIKNDIIIYTDKFSASKIEEIRIKKYKRKNTKIIIIYDYKKIDEDLYKSIKLATENGFNTEFRINPSTPESWNYDYLYLMILKEWFVKDSVEKKLAKGMISWMDFGYNHGGKYYTESKEFDFEWNWNFSDKIHLFTINKLDDLPIFEIIRSLNSYIQGGIIVAPDRLWLKLWNLVRENMLTLNKVGFSDDDQTILLMTYRQNKDMFELHECDNWFSIIDDYSNQKFTIKKSDNKKKKRKLSKKLIIKYLIRWFNILKNSEIKW
jgi:protein YibB